jgi:hypothetical protein
MYDYIWLFDFYFELWLRLFDFKTVTMFNHYLFYEEHFRKVLSVLVSLYYKKIKEGFN